MEKNAKYLDIYEPTLQAWAMRVACEHLDKVIALDMPLSSVCDKIDMWELIMAFEMEFDIDLIEEEKNIGTLNDIVELIRIRFSEEELKERLHAIAMSILNSPDDDEPESEDEIIASNPAEGVCDQESPEEQQMMEEIMNYMSDSGNDLDGLVDFLTKNATSERN